MATFKQVLVYMAALKSIEPIRSKYNKNCELNLKHLNNGKE
jgi:hypothetical protein